MYPPDVSTRREGSRGQQRSTELQAFETRHRPAAEQVDPLLRPQPAGLRGRHVEVEPIEEPHGVVAEELVAPQVELVAEELLHVRPVITRTRAAAVIRRWVAHEAGPQC